MLLTNAHAQLAVALAELSNVRITAYRSVPQQTDSTPFITSIGHRVSQQGCAVSPDLMASGEACYGDAITIDGIGLKIVNDTTHPRLKRTIDVWTATYAEEKKMGIRKAQRVVVVKSPTRFCTKAATGPLSVKYGLRANGIDIFEHTIVIRPE